MKSEQQIEEEVTKTFPSLERSKFPGMTYEEGVMAALDWVLGVSEESPMED